MAGMTVDDLNQLLGGPSQKPTEAPSGQPPMSVDELTKLTQPKAAPTMGFGEDLARSTGSGLGRGLVGATGLPGDIETLGRYGLNKMGANVDERSAFPTSEEMIHKAESLHPSVKEALGYQPKYAPSRYAKTAAEFIPSSLIGPGGLAAKTAGAVGAGVATQGVEDYAKGTPIEGTATEMALKLPASILGYGAGAKTLSAVRAPLAGAVTPEAEAMKRLTGAIQEDVSKGGKYGAKATPQEILASGTETAPAAIAGKKTQDLIQAAGEHVSPEQQGAFSNYAAKAAEGAKANVSSHIDDLFGGKEVLPFDKIDEGARRARDINSANYGRVMSSPEAQAIRAPELKTVMDRLPPNTLNEAIQSLKEHGEDLAALGIVKGKGGYGFNPQNMPLRFWDEVKQTLDTKIQGLKDPVTGAISDKGANSRWNSTNILLKDTLDNAVSEYGVIRGKAAEMAGAKNALEMGMKYLTSNNPANVNMIEKTIAKLTPEQHKDLAYGMAGAYKTMLEKDPNKALGLFTGKAGQVYVDRFNKAMAPLGPDAAANLIGKANAELLNRNIQAIKPQSGFGLKSQYVPAATGAAAAALHLGELVTQPMLWAGDPTAIIAGLGAYGLGKLYNAKEARIAAKVLELSADPKRMAELGQLIKSDPNARSFLNKTNEVLKKGARQQVGVGASMNQDEYPRAAGGRIGRATGGKAVHNHEREADILIARMEAAKKMEEHNTERLLQKDDTVIAKALAKANKDI